MLVGYIPWWQQILRSALFIKYGGAFLLAWIGVYYRRWKKKHDEQIAQGWPSVEGRIVFSKVAQIPKTNKWLATLTYTYFVGEYRTGEYHHEFPNEAAGEEFVRAMKDKNVQIRYKESNPDKSVLEQRAIEQHILLAPRFG
jgi:hypothetical protein